VNMIVEDSDKMGFLEELGVLDDPMKVQGKCRNLWFRHVARSN